MREKDLEKIKEPNSFDINSPKELQQKVFFDINYNFARRGRENLRTFNKSTLIFGVDDSGREYAEMSYNEKTKNHQGPEEEQPKHRMHEHPYMKDHCPVKTLKKYLSKLDQECDVFFTYPKKQSFVQDDKWYTSKPIGKNALGKFMQSISERLNLSMKYTNHSIRATTITQLSKAGFQSREIMRVSGHRCESSLRHYNADNSEQQKRQISDALNKPAIPTVQDAGCVQEEMRNSSPATGNLKKVTYIQNFYNYNCTVQVQAAPNN